jgi:hypothetical protein
MVCKLLYLYLIIAEGSRPRVRTSPSGLQPFSLGIRCRIGKSLATNELMLALASFFVRCDVQTSHCNHFRLGEGSSSNVFGRQRVFEYQVKDWLIAFRISLYLRPEPGRGKEMNKTIRAVS